MKLINRYRKIKKQAKELAHMEVSEAFKAASKHIHFQLKIRPRIKLLTKVILVLALTFLATSKTYAYLKPHEGDIKIKGQPVLVAQSKPEGKSISDIEISQNVVSSASPFSFQKPVEGGYVSQRFSFYHPAFDIAAPLGSPLHPVGSGVVSFAGFQAGGKGNVVIVDHGDGLKTLYAHMGKIYVGVGNAVNTNSELGTIGLTGRTTGPHVHFEVYDHDRTVDPGNFLPY